MKFKKSKIASYVVLFVLFMTALVTIAYAWLNHSVKKIIIQSVDELAEHDMRNIHEYTNGQLADMKALLHELEIENPSELEELQDTLNIKSTAGSFNKVYLIDADGNLYTDTYTIYDKSENDFLNYFNEENGKEFVRRYDNEKAYHEMKKEYLLYGISMEDEPVELAGVSFAGIVALNDISEIQDKMRITSFDDKGYSSVINGDGYYIVNIERTSSLDQLPNFFEMLQESRIQGKSVETIQQKIRSKEEIEFYCTDANGVKKYISIKPIENSHWFFVNSIEASVFTAQTYTFMVITMVVIVLLIMIFSSILTVFYLTRRKLKKSYSASVEGVYNRQYYDDKLAERYVMSLIIVDLDHLKKINDNYGHLAGDLAIEKIANVLHRNVGSIGDVVRYGGDEFTIALKVQVSKKDFQRRLDQILFDIRETKLDKYPEICLTASIGGYYQEGIVSELFKSADSLLYEAKKTRDCVVTNLDEVADDAPLDSEENEE